MRFNVALRVISHHPCQIKNALKNCFNVTSKNTSKNLLAHEYARTACGIAKKQLAAAGGGSGGAGAGRDKEASGSPNKGVAFLKVRGVETEGEVRELMKAQIGQEGLGQVEYVSLMSKGTHVVKCFDSASALAVFVFLFLLVCVRLCLISMFCPCMVTCFCVHTCFPVRACLYRCMWRSM
jgi:hypothetical protein